MKQLKKWRKPFLILLGVALFLLVGSHIPNYLSLDNILNVVRQSSIVSLVSYGMAMVIIIKGIDLSVVV